MRTDVDVAVVGAGIAGLAAADALRRAGREVQVFESADQVGGRMRAIRWNGFTIDTGAEMIATRGYPATWRLLRRIGMSDADAPAIGADVAMWRAGAAHGGVASPTALITGAGLSARGRVALARFTVAMWRRRRHFDADRLDETPLGETTVADLTARYGEELGAYLFQPLVSGMFGWHPQRSTAAPFVATMLHVGSPRGWRTYRDGMDAPARALAQHLTVHLADAVREVITLPNSALLRTDRHHVSARRVLLCVPAPVAHSLHVNAPEDERAYLTACEYGPAIRASLPLTAPIGAPSRRPAHILAVPGVEDDTLAGFTFDHVRYPGRAPAGKGLVTLLASPAQAAELLGSADDEVASVLLCRAERYLPGLNAATMKVIVHRFCHGLPSVTPAAVRLRAGFSKRPTRPVEYAGDWLMLRPSSEGAVRSAELAVTRLLTDAHCNERVIR